MLSKSLLVSLGLLLTVACEPASSDTDTDTDTDEPPVGEAPAFITTMTHLEGAWNYSGADGDVKFEFDVGKVKHGMDVFSEAEGIMTVESETPFALKSLENGNTIFTQLLEAGMGVGTHCDIVIPHKSIDCSDRIIIIKAIICIFLVIIIILC